MLKHNNLDEINEIILVEKYWIRYSLILEDATNLNSAGNTSYMVKINFDEPKSGAKITLCVTAKDNCPNST